MNIHPDILNLSYLVAATLFIYGLKGLTHPRTAVRGNLLGAIGMLIAIVTVLVSQKLDFTWIVAGLVLGTILGAILAVTVRMGGMPQMVALLNGFGGLASLLVAGEFLHRAELEKLPLNELIATAVSGVIGAVTFTGSMVAYAKLEEWKWMKDIRFPGQQLLNLALAVGCITLGALQVTQLEHAELYYWLMSAVALVLGVFLVVCIGGADMPVVIALLNSYSGLAAAATGFVYSNTVLIISGSLVGASGILLTQVMCKAMNRSMTNVLFGTLQPSGAGGPSAEEVYATVKSTTADEVAMLLGIAERVVIVPGYGMAVAQAQHAVRDLTKQLESKGIKVEFAIHPVAGRMPGHMNVLLAEVDIDYEKLREMDAINPSMDQVDVAIVLGANDVVNPVARTDANSPIYGMPIIDVDKARTVIVIKRSLSPGFAGIPNPLFAADNSLMLYADGKKAVEEITKALKEG